MTRNLIMPVFLATACFVPEKDSSNTDASEDETGVETGGESEAGSVSRTSGTAPADGEQDEGDPDGAAEPDPGGETTGTDPVVPDPFCGDGVVDPGEDCDDGNFNNNDSCPMTCEAPRCGDGYVSPDEACDDANNNDQDGCNSDCQLPECGNGVIDQGEECDDANSSNEDGCSTACRTLFFPGTNEVCNIAASLTCTMLNATCVVEENVLGSRYCYWPDRVDESACNDESSGIWTTPDSGFAAKHPTMVFPEPGVCVSQVINFRCGTAGRNACEAAGATLCFREKNREPNDPSICYWNVQEVGCEATQGIWTTQDSGFAQAHPFALPPGEDACITQVPNLE